MARSKDVIGQTISMVLKVNKAQIKEVKVKDKNQEVVELSCSTPEGTFVKISNFIRPTEVTYVNEENAKLKDIANRVIGGETIYVNKNIYVNKKGAQYGWLTSQVSDDGQIWHQIDGFVDELEFHTEEEVDIVSYEKFKTVVEKPFKEIVNDIKITMYVDEKTEDKVYFTNADQYEKRTVINVKDTSKVEIGACYDIKLKFKKGAKVEGEVVESSDWGNTAKSEGATFAPDELIPTAIRKTDLKMEGSNADEEDNELPF